MRRPFFYLLIPLILLYSAGPSFADPNETVPEGKINAAKGVYRLTFESVKMPQPGERMGLLGFDYLLDFSRYFYGGIGGYGALTGERGGFLTGGLEGGVRLPLYERLSGEGGLFVGGGGGSSSAGQGGGLMLRPHIGFNYDLEQWRIGLQLSKVKFPNGLIDSSEAVLAIDIPFTTLYTDFSKSYEKRIALSDLAAGSSSGLKDHLDFERADFSILYQVYFPRINANGVSVTAANNRMELIGAEVKDYFTDPYYFNLQIAGESGGQSDGYAEIFFGLGIEKPVAALNPFRFFGTLSIGSGGGGGLDTGGGALGKLTGGISYQNGPVTLSLDTGYIKSFSGTLGARIAGIDAGFEFDSLAYRSHSSLRNTDQAVNIAGWHVRASNEIYFTPQRKASDDRESISLIGVSADRVLSETFYLTGQAFSAWSGNAGGYSSGLVGGGMESPDLFQTGSHFKLELVAGAGGGGGIAVGGGAVLEPRVGMVQELASNLDAEIMGGEIISFSGDLHSPVLNVSLVYTFGKVESAGNDDNH